MKRLNIDVFVCVDTRHRESSLKRFTKKAKLILGDGAKVLHSPVASHLTSRNKYYTSVGGQMIVIALFWAPKLVDHYIEPTKFGLVSGVTLSTQMGQLLILGNYWPFPLCSSKEKQGLWTRSARFLREKKARLDQQEYIKEIINGKADKQNAKSMINCTVVCVDFNHRCE